MSVLVRYGVTCAVTSVLILTLIYGNPLNFIASLAENRFIGRHGVGLMSKFLFTSMLDVCASASVIISGYHILNLRKWKAVIYSIICVLFVCVACYFILRERTGANCSVQCYEIAFAFVTMYNIYYHSTNKRKIGFVLISISLLSCVPFVGSNMGLVKAVALPIIPILYVYGRQSFSNRDKVFALLCFAALIGYSYTAVRHFSYCDAGAISCKYEFKEGLAKGIRVKYENGDSISRVINDFRPYCRTNRIIILRNDSEYLYEYLFKYRNDYLRHIFYGTDDNDAGYVAWAKSEIENNGDKVAILRFGDCDRPSRMTALLNEYCKKVKIGDGYTIYVKTK
jgi:hypothetical protein